MPASVGAKRWCRALLQQIDILSRHMGKTSGAANAVSMLRAVFFARRETSGRADGFGWLRDIPLPVRYEAQLSPGIVCARGRY